MSHERLAALLFLALLVGVPGAQVALELQRGDSPHVLEVWDPVWETNLAERDRRLGAFEEALRTSSFIHRHAVPWYQLVLSAIFGRGNERAQEGRDGFLFYADDLDLVTGPGFLQPGAGGERALEVIADFREKLAERDIELLVVPVPIKGMLDAGKLQIPVEGGVAPCNPDQAAFFDALEARGIAHARLLEPLLELERASGDAGTYLPRDTHWTPEVMERVAAIVGERARGMLGESRASDAGFEATRVPVAGEGDLVRMLRLPASQTVFPPMELTIAEVRSRATGELVRVEEKSDVLLLGDSYTRVFSDPELGLGEGAGLAEHLALELDRPLDVIALLGGSATAVRETLARRRGGLDGKRLVIWELGMRVLGQEADTWRPVELPAVGESPAVTPDGAVVVEAEIVEVSRIPTDFNYDFCLVVHEYRVDSVVSGDLEDDTIWVAFIGVLDLELRPEASFQPGQRQRLVLEPVERHYELDQITWFDETDAGWDIWFATEVEPVR